MYKASDYIYKSIVQLTLDSDDAILKEGISLTLENAENIYDYPEDYLEGKYLEDVLSECRDEVRHNGEEISLSPKSSSRHYEVECVASKFEDVWITWDYYSGGGKHGDPSEFDWIIDSEILNLDEEKEVVTIVRTFSRK